jgi:CDP-glucose 4,6-dehydratase
MGDRKSPLESLGMNPEFWSGKRVFLTGHTGFKGSWLSLWLQQLGAEVYGYSDGVPTDPSLYETAGVGGGMNSVIGDVRDLGGLLTSTRDARPEVVIHMAAQSLVRRSYIEPVETYATNIQGTVNVLEAVRQAGGVRAVIVVTSDKCYENLEQQRSFREDDPMGGYDPYSSSKGCAELVTSAYRNSFFNVADFEQHGTAVASVRAGNVIGGGDWAEDRLIPDIIAYLQRGESPVIRNPDALRPWQFVLDPINGYLDLVERLCNAGTEYGGAWNFGPDDKDAREVGTVTSELAARWDGNAEWGRETTTQPHEATFLSLDSSKARSGLGWQPLVNLDTALDWIVEWYRAFGESGESRQITLEQIRRFQHEVTA